METAQAIQQMGYSDYHYTEQKIQQQSSMLVAYEKVLNDLAIDTFRNASRLAAATAALEAQYARQYADSFLEKSRSTSSLSEESQKSLKESAPALAAKGERVTAHGKEDKRKNNRGCSRRKSYSVEVKLQCIRLRQSGKTCDEVAQIIGTARSNVEKWCAGKNKDAFLKDFMVTKTTAKAPRTEVLGRPSKSPTDSSQQEETGTETTQDTSGTASLDDSSVESLDDFPSVKKRK
jgi:transposase-like protein